MKFFFKDAVFIRKLLIIIFLVLIILLLVIGRFRTMRVKMVGLDEAKHTFMEGKSLKQVHEGISLY